MDIVLGWIKGNLVIQMFKREEIKFFVLEILTYFINFLIYNVLVKLNISLNISAIISFLCYTVINYFLCYKYVFKNAKTSKKGFLIFEFYSVIGYYSKKILFDLMFLRFGIHYIISKTLTLFIVVIYDYITKKSIFHWNYKIDRKYLRKIYFDALNFWEDIISKKYIKMVFKFIPHNIFIFIFFIAGIYFSLIFFKNNDDVILYQRVIVDGNNGQMLDVVVDVDFDGIEVNNDADIVCLAFGTYQRENDSNLKFELYNESNRKTFESNINTNILKDGQFYCLKVPEISSSKLKDYHLKVTSSNTNRLNSVTMLLDKETKQYAMVIKKSHSFLDFKHLVLLFYVVFFFIINYFINKNGNRINENKFLLMMVFYIISILFINPPLIVPDEPSHFDSSYNLSQNVFRANEVTEISVPQNIECLNYVSLQNLNMVTDFDDVRACLSSSSNKRTNTLFGASNLVTNSALGHTPQAISIKIADIISNSPLFIFYFARFGNFLLAFILLYCAIKITPVYKKLLLFVGLIPMFIQQEASLSYDSLINSMSILFVAYILKFLYSKSKFNIKDIFIPIIYLLVSLTVKPIYAPLIILIFFIPKECFKNTKQKTAYLLLIFIISFSINYLLKNILFNGVSSLETSSFAKQVDYILHNPFELFPIAINTFKINSFFYLRGLFGYFAWFSFSLSDFIICCCCVFFVILILNESNIFKSKKNYQWILLLVAILISVAGIFASMYFCWSEYKFDFVEGVQGRYFIPLLLPIAVVCMPKKGKDILSKKNLYLFINILLLQYVLYTIIFFY